ncbi:protein of unknown function [Denitratisoma oestradiolicum]|uniref:Uncharacterized protein n=1 Tax=Denitratisoma oestradiolicum TaxID=311182 RepID=A0A6S6XV79_9PROT|nr:protein of unknown function [Denitratisoma oestradiolicum]
MRGTRDAHSQILMQMRFIPAHAGNTACRSQERAPVSVHPRACGEHNAGVSGAPILIGSSPRMRGTLSLLNSAHRPSRFIPAHAGNTSEG